MLLDETIAPKLNKGLSHNEMLVAVDVSVNELVKLGKKFQWPRVPCPACGARVWWHGFVLAYFSIFPSGIYIRRTRCPVCKRVHRLKPKGFWKNFRFSKDQIRNAVKTREKTGRYPTDNAEKHTMRKWWRTLGTMIKIELSLQFTGTRLGGFDELVSRGLIPVSCAKQYRNRTIT